MIKKIARKIRSILATLITRVVGMRLSVETHQGGRVIAARDVEGLRHVAFGGKNAVGRGAVFGGEISVGFGTTIGPNDCLNGPLSIGNYCQLGAGVGIYGKDHPKSYASIYINRNLFDGRLDEHSRVEKVQVGHDVWIGHGAILLRGVSVGTGAIIGANAVVTSSVQPYAIVAGSPARVVRLRFPEEIVDLFQQFRWWEMTPEELIEYEDIFHVDFNKETNRGVELLRDAIKRRRHVQHEIKQGIAST